MSPPTDRDREAGYGTLLGLGIVGVTLVLLLAALTLLSAVLASHRAATAADLAALAAASATPPSCAQAERVARLHEATLARCVVLGPFVEVDAVVEPLGPAAHLGEARARARAGPGSGPARARQQRQEEISGADRSDP